jgi:hypothetical protein
MSLKIIVEKSSRYKENISKLCSAAGIGDYDILDPISHEINRQFPYVLMLGAIRAPYLKATKIWQTDIPETNMSNDVKMKIFGVFKEAATFVNANRESTKIVKGDLPKLKDLKEYLNELNGRVVELTLDDNRIIGIYPDGQPMRVKYDLEYHASTIVNLARINELFDVKRIMIKEI